MEFTEEEVNVLKDWIKATYKLIDLYDNEDFSDFAADTFGVTPLQWLEIIEDIRYELYQNS